MLIFSINRLRGYDNPSFEIIVIDLFSTGGFHLEEAHEHFFHIQSVNSVVILISFQCYCGECSGYIAFIFPLLAFYLCSAYILYLVYYIVCPWELFLKKYNTCIQPFVNERLHVFNMANTWSHGKRNAYIPLTYWERRKEKPYIPLGRIGFVKWFWKVWNLPYSFHHWALLTIIVLYPNRT